LDHQSLPTEAEVSPLQHDRLPKVLNQLFPARNPTADLELGKGLTMLLPLMFVKDKGYLQLKHLLLNSNPDPNALLHPHNLRCLVEIVAC
jgi:hypothetical protein